MTEKSNRDLWKELPDKDLRKRKPKVDLKGITFLAVLGVLYLYYSYVSGKAKGEPMSPSEAYSICISHSNAIKPHYKNEFEYWEDFEGKGNIRIEHWDADAFRYNCIVSSDRKVLKVKYGNMNWLSVDSSVN